MEPAERARLRTDAALDQRWAEMDADLGDLQTLALARITASREDRAVPASGNDRAAELVTRALGLVVAELYARRAKRHTDDRESS